MKKIFSLVNSKYKKICYQIGEYFLKKSKVFYVILPDQKIFDSLLELVKQAEDKFTTNGGDFKHAQVMRAAMNRHPNTPRSLLGLSLEMAVRKIKGGF